MDWSFAQYRKKHDQSHDALGGFFPLHKKCFFDLYCYRISLDTAGIGDFIVVVYMKRFELSGVWRISTSHLSKPRLCLLEWFFSTRARQWVRAGALTGTGSGLTFPPSAIWYSCSIHLSPKTFKDPARFLAHFSNAGVKLAPIKLLRSVPLSIVISTKIRWEATGAPTTWPTYQPCWTGRRHSAPCVTEISGFTFGDSSFLSSAFGCSPLPCSGWSIASLARKPVLGWWPL